MGRWIVILLLSEANEFVQIKFDRKKINATYLLSTLPVLYSINLNLHDFTTKCGLEFFKHHKMILFY